MKNDPRIYGKDVHCGEPRLIRSSGELGVSFDSGNEMLDAYLESYKRENADSVLYVFENTATQELIGYVALQCSGVQLEISQGYIQTFPAIEIECFALAKRYQKMVYDETDKHYYMSDKIFCDVVTMCHDISENYVGAKYLYLYAVPGKVHFYKRNLMQTLESFCAEIQTQSRPDSYRYLDGCIPMIMAL